jgi:hypothetical protein
MILYRIPPTALGLGTYAGGAFQDIFSNDLPGRIIERHGGGVHSRVGEVLPGYHSLIGDRRNPTLAMRALGDPRGHPR